MLKGLKMGLALGAMAIGFAAAQPAQAAITNGSFEAFPDFAGWSTTGNTTIQDSTYKTPTDGSVQALLTNGTGAVSATSLESFLNLTAGALTSKGATNGSAIKQSITVAAGDVVTFNFDFATNEAPNIPFNDFGFVSVAPTNTTGVLADTNSPSSPTSNLFGINSDFSRETGYLSYSVKFTSAGSYTLGFGVVNVGDTSTTSGLLLDNVVETSSFVGVPNLVVPAVNGGGGNAVPLPAGVYVLPLGLAMAVIVSVKMRRANAVA